MDTSVLFRLIYGNKAEKTQIKSTNKSYSEVVIDSIIKAEVGRTVYYTYSLLKNTLLDVMGEVEVGAVSIDAFWGVINQRLQKKHRYKNQLFSRLLTISYQIIDRLFRKYEVLYTGEEGRINVFITNVKSTILQIENELFSFQKLLDSFTFIKNFDCHQIVWKFTPDDSSACFKLELNLSCSKEYCPNRNNVINDIYELNYDFIENFLSNSKKICDEHNIDADKRLYKTLEKLKEEYLTDAPYSHHTKYCWNLGDLLISLNVRRNRYLYTSNYNHFYVLLKLRNLEKQILLFN